MSTTRAIGGYFGLRIDGGRAPEWLARGQSVQSGRVALAMALPSMRATLWVPSYFCPPVARALEATGWTLRAYPLDGEWGPVDAVAPRPNDRVLLVDYFGLSSGAVRRSVERFGSERMILDHSLALFSPPIEGIPTAYSPRKFAGLPDGGILVNGPAAKLATADESGSAMRSRHLLLRAAGDVQGGRGPFAEAEASLDDDLTPREMSQLTRRLLGAVDFEAAAERRRRNYDRLAAGLGSLGFEVIPRSADAVPLCCPVYGLDPLEARPRLAGDGVFCAAYWPGLVLPKDDAQGRRLVESTTFLPCDQRYDDGDIDFMLDRIAAMRACP